MSSKSYPQKSYKAKKEIKNLIFGCLRFFRSFMSLFKFRYKIKINKQFVDILAKKKFGTIGEIIKEMKFLKIEDNVILNLAEEYKTVEEIYWTIYFLKEYGLIKKTGKGYESIDFKMKTFLKEGDKYFYERMEFINRFLENYWNQEIKITPKFYGFLINNYKTKEQIDEKRNVWLPIMVAILASVLTAVLTVIFQSIFTAK